VGGADSPATPANPIRWGTPPRGRGRPEGRDRSRRRRGNTPAWAGPTHPLFDTTESSEEHPRVGGADVTRDDDVIAHNGTPPRGRGRHMVMNGSFGPMRNTPAWAGPTTASTNPTPSRREHPRVGGADATGFALVSAAGGTPPRGRGRPDPAAVKHLIPRNTPAWAGPTSPCRASETLTPEHPRVGGADSTQPWHPKLAYGTPPRGRGRRYSTVIRKPMRRNTPAWAGPTGPTMTTVGELREHPRVGGADVSSSRPRPVSQGTPPRGRGRLGVRH